MCVCCGTKAAVCDIEGGCVHSMSLYVNVSVCVSVFLLTDLHRRSLSTVRQVSSCLPVSKRRDAGRRSTHTHTQNSLAFKVCGRVGLMCFLCVMRCRHLAVHVCDV